MRRQKTGGGKCCCLLPWWVACSGVDGGDGLTWHLLGRLRWRPTQYWSLLMFGRNHLSMNCTPNQSQCFPAPPKPCTLSTCTLPLVTMLKHLDFFKMKLGFPKHWSFSLSPNFHISSLFLRLVVWSPCYNWQRAALLSVSGFPLRLENLENEYGHGTWKICQKSWNYSNFAPKCWSPLRNWAAI